MGILADTVTHGKMETGGAEIVLCLNGRRRGRNRMRRKLLFIILVLFCIASLFAKPEGKTSVSDQVLYKCCLLSFFIPLTIASGLWCNTHKPAKKLWGIAILISLTAGFVTFLALPEGIQEGGMAFSEKESGDRPDLEKRKETDRSEGDPEMVKKSVSTNEGKEDRKLEKGSEIGKEPVRFLYDDTYIVGNVKVRINEIQIRQNVYQAGNHTLEFRIFCELVNTSPTEQYFTATKTGNIVGVFHGKEETQIGGMDNLLWDKEDDTIGTGITVPADGTKELVVQAGTVITDAVTYGEELKFDVYFRNNEELLTVTFDCQP